MAASSAVSTASIPRLSAARARRIAVAAQGLAAPRPAVPGMRQLTAVVDRIGLLQMDSVNVLVRSHYLPLFSRLGPYDVALLDRAAGRAPRRLVEYWAHEASLVPPMTYRLLRWRMSRWQEEAWGSMRRIAVEHPKLVAAVLAEVRDRGPITAADVEIALAHDVPRSKANWGWNWSLVKQAIEHLFWSGEVMSAGRTAQFERRYAVPERVLPPAVLDAPDLTNEEAFTELTRIAARAHGVGSEQCLRDYFRLSPDDGRVAIGRLLDEGTLLPVRVEGWKRPAYLHRDARVPRPCGPGPCSRRSTPSSGSAPGWRRCSASATASRSTCRRPSGCMATTCCRSCSTTGWSPASTSRQTAARVRFWCGRRGPRHRRRRRPRHSLRPSCATSRPGSVSVTSSRRTAATWHLPCAPSCDSGPVGQGFGSLARRPWMCSS